MRLMNETKRIPTGISIIQVVYALFGIIFGFIFTFYMLPSILFIAYLLPQGIGIFTGLILTFSSLSSLIIAIGFITTALFLSRGEKRIRKLGLATHILSTLLIIILMIILIISHIRQPIENIGDIVLIALSIPLFVFIISGFFIFKYLYYSEEAKQCFKNNN